MKFVSIYKKLVTFARWLLMVTIGALFVSTLINIYDLQLRLNRIESDIKKNLISKGKLLITNNSQALRGMAEDNAFTSIELLVAATVQEDLDVEYGIYMSDTRKPWAYADSSGVKRNVPILDDPQSMWAHKVKGPELLEYKKAGSSIIEFAAPVMVEGERLGTIRYGLTTVSMQASITATKAESFTRSVINTLLVVFVGLVVFIWGLRIARRKADTITRPLDKLTHAADAISKGDYTLPVEVTSDDEVGILADSFEAMRITIREYTENLELKVEERTKQIASMQKELVEQAHKSGMAEIATAVLHNIGNILNSVMTSGEQLKEIVNQSSLKGLHKANTMLNAHMGDIENFIANDPKGKKLLSYYLALETMFEEEYGIMDSHADRLMLKIKAIRDVILAQQSYASGGRSAEEIEFVEVIEDTFKLYEGTIARHNMQIKKDFSPAPHFFLQRVKVMQIIMNLFKNAKEAMVDLEPDKKVITISIKRDENFVYIEVSDTGCGINRKNLKKIFNHGFTTKKDGHGFGLHSCANYMTEMHGKIKAESEGEGKGATFSLCFEISNEGRSKGE
ncbi:MAG: HAMP domain-containing protein [bacterium]|nr:HAMP domain-containing protein [bacterium]